MHRMIRQAILMCGDAIVVFAALFAAVYLRFDFTFPPELLHNALRLSPYFMIGSLICFQLFSLYNGLWQYTNLHDAARVGLASIVSSVWLVILINVMQIESFPRSIPLITAGIVCVLTGFNRLSIRVVRSVLRRRGAPSDSRRSLVVGAGDAGVMLVQDMIKHGVKPVGIVDDNPSKRGETVRGVPVLGNRHDIVPIAKKHGVNDIIIAIPSAPRQVIREIYEIARQAGDVSIRVVPALFDIATGKVQVGALRPIDLSDLLGRDPVQIDVDDVQSYINGRRVLVTGAGGSIGSELCRQLAGFHPELLVIVDHDENAIFDLQHDLNGGEYDVHYMSVIADVRDRGKIMRVFAEYSPEVVFHAAAHKHVSFMENEPEEAVKTNVLGTENVALAAIQYDCESFVLVSTDKAVNPTSVMGASKRVAEYIIHKLNGSGKTKFVAVRFGNVLGSRGSVVPLFQSQIEEGGPITVTDPEMIRYFMTIPEASQLVIQAGAIGRGGEVFVLDMGEPVKIVDLATTLIKLYGLEPHRDIQIKFTGKKPGEKLFEELLTDEEGIEMTTHNRIFSAQVSLPQDTDLDKLLEKLKECTLAGNQHGIIEQLCALIPTFTPDSRRWSVSLDPSTTEDDMSLTAAIPAK